MLRSKSNIKINEQEVRVFLQFRTYKFALLYIIYMFNDTRECILCGFSIRGALKKQTVVLWKSHASGRYEEKVFNIRKIKSYEGQVGLTVSYINLEFQTFQNKSWRFKKSLMSKSNDVFYSEQTNKRPIFHWNQWRLHDFHKASVKTSCNTTPLNYPFISSEGFFFELAKGGGGVIQSLFPFLKHLLHVVYVLCIEPLVCGDGVFLSAAV